MRKKTSVFIKNFTSICLLFALIGCNMNIPEINKSVANDSSIRKSVAKSIQQQLEILEDYPDEDVLDLLNAKDVTGDEVVTKALGEEKGIEYLDFCYAANQTSIMLDSSYIMDRAKGLMDSKKYNELKAKIDDNE